MKKKKGIWVFVVIVLALIIGTFFLIKRLTTTSYGKVNMKVAVMLKVNKYFNPNSIKGKPINEIREILNKDSTIWSAKPIPFSNIRNVNIDISSTKIPVRIYTPEGGSNLPIIVYLHGGFWIAGNLDTIDNVCRKLSKNTKAIVVSVDYRLAPENPFPAGVNDAYNVIQWVYKNAESINGDAKHIAVAGDSAGGNIAAAVSQMVRDKNGPHITCQVLVYPSTNLFELNSKSWSQSSNDFNISREDMEKYISLYIPKKEDRKNPYASPLLAKDFKGLPHTLIIIAEIDPLRDEGEAYAEKLKHAGDEVVVAMYKGTTHGFLTMDRISGEGDKALNQISLYLQKEFQKDKL
ncbi:alpha/beta hydrolase [Clostridium aciditolerans]|uniref:Alpha/beta hydrolase n=1 Tax=Clostridium aciditolerans TaxID=339861 RepID=A0A934HVE9_9CLOT|nr:alpha/beta hydrolase [Clostridium aciditolerans]MBI6871277.1 alpha/beta hydrolase [Clostridium aciditolerans]